MKKPNSFINPGISLSITTNSLINPGINLSIFFFLAFAIYTIEAAREMNDVVFSSSCLQP